MAMGPQRTLAALAMRPCPLSTSEEPSVPTRRVAGRHSTNTVETTSHPTANSSTARPPTIIAIGPAAARLAGSSTRVPSWVHAATRERSVSGTCCWTVLACSVRNSAPCAPTATASAATSHTAAPTANATRYGIMSNAAPIAATSGRRGRHRNATAPPRSEPSAWATPIVAHTPAPP